MTSTIIHTPSIARTLRLKHGRVVIDVLNEDRHWEVGGGAVPTVTRQTEPKQILVMTILYCGKGDEPPPWLRQYFLEGRRGPDYGTLHRRVSRGNGNFPGVLCYLMCCVHVH